MMEPRLMRWLPSRSQVRSGLMTLALVLGGATLLAPLVGRLPMPGWDWYFFFNRHNPAYNLTSARSAYPPFARYFMDLLTWMDWRTSLALLNCITLLSVSVATWRQGGRYGSILLALLTPPLWFLLWIGHPDGLALLGLITGLIPLALIKPQLTLWSLLHNRLSAVWTIGWLALSLLIWPLWPLKLVGATLVHEAAFGWVVLGWPVLALGLLLLLGAGDDLFRLMAAGFLVSPYLMPYNLAILLPILGQVRGKRQLIIWCATWLTVLGVGLGGTARVLNLAFPIAAYCCTHSIEGYKRNAATVLGQAQRTIAWIAAYRARWAG